MTIPRPLRRYVGPLVRFGRRPGTRRAGAALAMLVVTAVGMVIAVLLAGKITAEVGPFHAEMSIRPAVQGGTDVAIPPLGSLHLATHYGPAHLSIHLNALDERRTRELVSNPDSLAHAGDNAIADLKAGLFRLVFQVAGAAVLGGMLFAAVVYRRIRRVATAGVTALGLLVASGGIAYGTFRPGAIEEPRYEGLLINAPAVVGNARQIAGRYSEYRGELQRLVQNVNRLYDTISTLPVYEPDTSTVRVLHISDMHLNPAAWSVVRTVVAQFHIQLVIDTGDLTDWGSEPEDSYVANIASLKVPYVFIRGNHDSVSTAAAVARQPNATVLDGGSTEKDGLLIAGIGDPRFTPDKSTPENAANAKDPQSEAVVNSGRILADSFVEMDRSPDIALVHDPASARRCPGRYRWSWPVTCTSARCSNCPDRRTPRH